MKSILFSLALLLAGDLHAHSLPGRPEVKAAKIQSIPAWEDIFTDPRWQQADPVSLCAPSNVTFSHPPEGTQVRLLWCKDYLLMRFDCDDQSIVHLPGDEASRGQRDLPYYKADSVEVFLDPVGDSRMWMEFQFNPNNGVFDAIYFCTATPRSRPDFFLTGEVANHQLFFIPEWNLDGLLTAARVRPDAKGWSAIAAFPAKEILKRWGKTEFAAEMKMKVNFVRFNYFSDGQHPVEITNWAPVLGGCAHMSPKGMGTIVLEP